MNYQELSGSTLAYIGDAVLSLMVREHLINQGYTKAKDLQEKSILFVSAKAQARYLDYLRQEEALSTEEELIYKRGRNHKSESIPKNVDTITYRKATGLEALWGYIYLEGNQERLEQLFNIWKNQVILK